MDPANSPAVWAIFAAVQFLSRVLFGPLAEPVTLDALRRVGDTRL